MMSEKLINLENQEILSSSEACQEWGIDSSTLRKRIPDFSKGTIRKFGTTYVVTRKGMTEVFGQPKCKRIEGGNHE